MAAYAALLSVMHIIQTLQNHPHPPITIDEAQRQSLTQKLAFLQEFLESYNFHGGSEQLERLQSRIADAAHAAEDVIESHTVAQIYLSRSTRDWEETGDIARLQKLIEAMDFIKRGVTEIIKEKMNDMNNPYRPTALDKKQVEYEKISILKDFVKSYSYLEMACSFESNGVDQIVTANNDILQTLFRAYNSFADECLQTSVADRACKGEDTHIVLDLICGRSIYTGGGKNASSVDFYQRLQKVIGDMDLIEREVEEIRNKVGLNDLLRITVKETDVSSKSLSNGQNNIMVGFDDVLYQILQKLKGQGSDRRIIPIVGMGGIGKTTLAKNVYESKLVKECFDISCWVTISQEYNVEDVISEILSPKNKGDRARSSGIRELGSQLYKHLYGRRYLIIFDDMWSTDVWDELKKFIPKNNCGSRIIVTTRLSKLAVELSGTRGLEMSFLDEKSSWTLLSKIVFGEEGCPHEGLEEIGKKIAGNCKGLPLSIVVIGGLLTKRSEPAYWKYVAGNLNSFVNLEDDERCYKTLRTSYDLLPTHLKPCFLYMAIYPEDRVISVSELIKLWVAEGFLKPINGKSLEVAAREYLMDLIDRNLVLVHAFGSSSGKVKSCTMHDVLRDLCLKEARKEKFLCVPTKNGLSSEGISIQRRFAIHKTTSMEFHNSKKVAFKLASPARSFIFFIPVAVLPSLNSGLLRVLEARNKRLDFVFNYFVNLRHLALQSPWKSFEKTPIPSSVYHLWNLQTLIVGLDCAAPPEIWKMPLLKHVKFLKLYLPDPPGSDIDREGDDFVLWNLQTLTIVFNFKFGEGVTKRILNIQKLKLCYEDVKEGFEVASHYLLNNLGSLHKLESLGCIFVPNRPSRSDLLQNLTFPHSLRKLILRGTGLNWEDMSTTIGPLPLLEVLKLYEGSFNGPRWETVEGQFCNLRYLLIESCYGLENWITESTHFPRLEHLVLKDLDFLEEIPLCIGEISTLQSMKVEYCSNGVVNSAKAILQEAQEECGNASFRVQVMSSRTQYVIMHDLATPNFQVKTIENKPVGFFQPANQAKFIGPQREW